MAMQPCVKPDFSTALTLHHKWATGGWPPMARACLNCGTTRDQAQRSETALQAAEVAAPTRWGNVMTQVEVAKARGPNANLFHDPLPRP